MAQVPARYPVEPNAKRCGESYKTSGYVTGEIPGTDFGLQLNETIKPIRFGDNSVADPGLWPEIGLGGWEYAEADGQIRERIESAFGRIEIFNHIPAVTKEAPALRWLLEHATAELNAADDVVLRLKDGPVPGSQFSPAAVAKMMRDQVVARMQDALKHLRCAEYWTARLKLYSEAVDAYVPPPRDPSGWLSARVGEPRAPLGFRTTPPPPPSLPDADSLPPPDAVGEASSPEAAQWWKVAAAVAGVAAAFFFLPRLMAINPRTGGR